MNVLVVDDEATMRRMLGVVLQKRGFTVCEAASAGEALAVSEEHLPDLLLTDVVMEGIDGIALARLLVERYPSLAVLFISGYSLDPGTLEQFPRAAFLSKPFDPWELVAVIKRLTAASPKS